MTALAVSHFIFGTLYALSGLFVIIVATTRLARDFQPDDQQGAAMLLLASGLLMLPLAAFLVAAGIGVLRMASWGRTFSLVFAWPMLFYVLINGAVQFFKSLTSVHTTAEYTGFVIGTLLGLSIAVAYPIVVLVVFSRPSWKRAFVKGR
jgi:hypothetical protein